MQFIRSWLPLSSFAALACIGLVAWVIPAAAYNNVGWQPAPQNGLPTAGAANGVAYADMDRDGRIDLVAAMPGNGIRVWRNLGGAPPSWSAWTGPALPTTGDWKAVTVADINFDTRPDIIAAGEGLGVHIFRTTGGGSGSGWDEQVPDATTSYYDVATGDVSGDGKLDIVAARHTSAGGSGLTLWAGNGTGMVWTAYPAPNAFPAVGVALGDFDYNGLLDIATASDWAGGRVQAWFQLTAGSWSESSSGLPSGTHWHKIVAADFNLDGKLDLAATGDQGVQVWSGTGANNWIANSGGLPASGAYMGLATGDLDHDGRPDLAAAGAQANGIAVWGNTAGGWTALAQPETSQTWASVTLADFDNNGILDLVGGYGWSLGIKLWMSSGTAAAHGSWMETASSPPGSVPQAIAPADVNRDGWTDVPVAGSSNGLTAWAGPVANSWTACANSLPGSGNYRSLVAGQIWGSSDPELIAGSGANAGLQAFTLNTIISAPCYWMSGQFSGLPVTGTYRALALGQIDRDGLPELVGAVEGSGLSLWKFNPTTRIFSPESASPIKTGSYDGVALADFNRDGFLDIAAAGSGTARGLWVWRWTDGIWTAPSMVDAANDYAAVAVGDLNHDGYLDIIGAARPLILSAKAPSSSNIRAWLGDGSGQNWQLFADPGSSLLCNSLDLGDYDNDGNLDLLCSASQGLGLWRLQSSPAGGWAWVAGSPGLPTDGIFTTARFAHIDHDGLLDILAGYSLDSRSRVRGWTAADTLPPAWGAFAPTGWVNSTQSVPCTIQVTDIQSGVNTASAQYARSTDGGSSWGSWAAATFTGSATGTLSATVPFGKDSGSLNRVRFRIADQTGNSHVSADYNVRVDTKPPTRPLNLNITDHTLHTWSANPAAAATWGLASDDTSGIDGYSYAWTPFSPAMPGTTLLTHGTSASTIIPGDGANWWFHVRTVDFAGNWSVDAMHMGPYLLDTQPPSNPTSFSGSHQPSVWSRVTSATINWSGAADPTSPINGYSYSFNHGIVVPPASVNAVAASGSASLSNGTDWYINVRTRDMAGNWSPAAKSYGPFYIDTQPPSAIVSSPINAGVDFMVSLTGTDPPAGGSDGSQLVKYDVQMRDKTISASWSDWKIGVTVPPGNPNTQLAFHGQDGHIYEFRARASDLAGNLGQYPADAQTFTRVNTIDFAVIGMEVNQAIQDLNNSVPLVQHKTTYVRFHVRMKTGANTGPVAARLRGYSLTQAASLGEVLPENTGGTIAVLSAPNRAMREDSFYFRLPQNWTTGNVRLMLEVNHDLRWADADHTNNTLSFDAVFFPMPSFHLWIGDACYTWNGLYRHVRPEDVLAVRSWLLRAYPISQIVYEWGGSMGCLNAPPESSTVNNLLWWIRTNRVSSSYWERYLGLVINDAWPGGWMRGSTPLPTPNLDSSSPAGSPVGVPSAAWDTDNDSFADWYSAHELGHALGRPHTACNGLEANPGPFPNPNGDISPTQDLNSPQAILGFDTQYKKVYGPGWKDIMTYCDNDWISDYTYNSLRLRIMAEGATAGMAEAAAAAPQDYLFVTGTIAPVNQITLGPFYHAVMERDRLGRTPGDYSIRLLDAGGGTLADYPFTPRVNEPEVGTDRLPAPTTVAIAETVPWVTGTAKVAILYGGQELAARVVSASKPQVSITEPGGRQSFTGPTLTLRWQGSDLDGDSLTYGVLFSRDGGATWQPLGNGLSGPSLTLETAYLGGTTQGKFRVVVTDGVNQGQGDSGGLFTVPDKTPSVRITLPAGGQRFVPGQLVTLGAEAFDFEDGVLGDAALSWSSGLSGPLGSGLLLDKLDLPAGLHTITVTATDSAGNQAQASLSIFIGDLATKLYLPLISK